MTDSIYTLIQQYLHTVIVKYVQFFANFARGIIKKFKYYNCMLISKQSKRKT